MDPEPLTVDARITAQMMRRYTAMQSSEEFSGMKLPAEHFVLMRAVFLLIGLLGQLSARNTWLDIAREWLFREPPATELGVQEGEFFGGRFEYPTEVAA